MNNRKLLKTVQYVILVTGVVLILLPMFLVVITAFKSNLQIADNWFSLPIPLYLDNFKELLAKPDLKYAFMNSIVIAGAFLIISTLLLPVTAYGVSRTMAGNRFMRYFYYFLIIGLFVPFQAKMIPLIMIASKLGMMNVAGIIILYIAGSTCEGVFLCAGYLQSIPPDMEEASYIDGAGFFRTYWQVILPLMKPILATVAIQHALWVWNDFQLPLLVLNKSSKFWTLILYVYNFKTAYQTDFGLIFASFLISMLPIMVFYVCMQKQIIGGLTSGAVKG